MPKKKLLSLKEAGKILGIHFQTVRNRINDGTIKSIKVGNLRKIPIEEIDRVLRDGTGGGK